jgi:hypothetical protein
MIYKAVLLLFPFAAMVKKLLLFITFSWPLFFLAQLELPDNVPFYIQSTQWISSQTAMDGQEYTFTVMENVVVNNQIIIEAGAKAYGIVTLVGKNSFLGKPGIIEIEMDFVEGLSLDYPIQGPVLYSEGRPRKSLSILLSIFVSPLFLFLKGQSANITPNTEIEVFLDNGKKRSRRN